MLLPPGQVERSVLVIRGQSVLLDETLADLYAVTTGALVQAVRRNIDRFPADFMFQLTDEEFAFLRSRAPASASGGWGGRRFAPYAFTEQGVAMLSSVLRSPRAVQVNIEIMRAFVRLRRMLATHADLARRIDELEATYDDQFKVVFEAIRMLMTQPEEEEPKKPPIGFRAPIPPHIEPKPRSNRRLARIR